MPQDMSYRPSVLVETEKLTRPEWLEYRRRGIGGSDAAAVLGISPFRTARDLYYDKAGIVTADDRENWVALEYGTLLEPLVARIFAEKTGLKIYQRKCLFQHPLHPWMLADLDYLVELPDGSTAILEIKTTNYNAKDKWWRDGEETVPAYYESQGRHYMAVMNLDRVYYCCLYGNSEDDALIRHIDRDMDYELELISLEQDFWENNVLVKLPPPYLEENGDLILESLRRTQAQSPPVDGPVNFTQTQSARVTRYLELQEEKRRCDTGSKAVESEMKRLKALIVADMGASSSAISADGFIVSWKVSRTPGIFKDGLERLREVHPEIYSEYVTYSERRNFSIRRPKEDVA